MATIDETFLNGSGSDLAQSMDELRLKVVADGLDQPDDGSHSYRLYLWLILLYAKPIAYDEYAALLERGASPAYGKIQNDVHRTLTTDPYFAKRVTQSSLTRLLNTIAWSTYDRLAAETPLPPSPTLGPEPDGGMEDVQVHKPADQPKADLYVQGMNVLAAPLLFVSRSEPAAFSLLRTLLHDQIPTYFSPGLSGVHVALNLLDKVLAQIDPVLFQYLPRAETYAFGPIMTLCASIPPLSEVLRLWDFLFASEPYLGVLVVAGILIGMRDELLNNERPGTRLRNLGPLDARKTITTVRSQIAPQVLQTELGEELIKHTRISGGASGP